jgi:hypothetical protein
MSDYRTARKYPRDVAPGARLLVKMATATGSRMVPATLTELTQDRSTYRVVVESDKHGRMHWRQAANAKLNVITR